MTDKELKKLGRRELLEMLIVQTRRNENLEKNIADLQQQLASRELSVQRAGDLAGAVMELNGVFESARNACEQYKLNIERMEEQCRKDCERLRTEAQQEAARIVEKANEKARTLQNENAASGAADQLTDG